jgi:hypothetical protein
MFWRVEPPPIEKFDIELEDHFKDYNFSLKALESKFIKKIYEFTKYQNRQFQGNSHLGTLEFFALSM